MKPIYHVAISTGLSAIVYAWFKSIPAAMACFLSGIFIDLDHHLDYFICQRKIPSSYKKLLEWCAAHKTGRFYMIFHSYELLTILWLNIYFLKLDEIWIGFALGVSVHLICDQIVNPLKPLYYFLIYRFMHRFDRRSLYKEEYVRKYL